MSIQINGTSGISGVDGSAATPALQGTDTNTGLSFGTNELSLNTDGTERFRVGSAGQLGIGGATYGTSGQVLTSGGASAAPSWQTITSTEYQGPAFYAYISTNQTLTSGTWTRVTYQTEVFDTDNCFDNSTNYRFTPTKAGYYFATARHHFDYTGSAPSVTGIGIRKNNTTAGDNVQVGVGGYGSTPGHSHLVYMNGSTDYLDVFAYANVANVYLGTSEKNAFMAFWVHD